MKTNLFKFFPFAALLFVLISCTSQNANYTLKPVFVSSGKIESSNFKATNAFKATDATLGRIDSSAAITPNAFLSTDGYMYVFEGKAIPPKISALSLKSLGVELASLNWQKDVSYTFNEDAYLLNAHPKYYVREAGTYSREVANYQGSKVFRMLDSYVIEDYTKLENYLFTLHTAQISVNLFDALGISPDTYAVSASRSDLLLDARTGHIDYKNSTPTAVRVQDKLRFTPKNGNARTYRLRFVLSKYDDEAVKKYFNKGLIRPGQEKAFRLYLLEQKLPVYLEQKSDGYAPSNLKSTGEFGPPPPPEFIFLEAN